MPIRDQFDVMHEGTSESGDQASAEATLHYLGPWPLRWEFVREMLGTTQDVGVPPEHVIQRTVPQVYPDNPSLYASHFKIFPRGRSYESGSTIAYDKCVVQIRFTNPDFDYESPDGSLDSLIYASEDLDFAADFQNLPASAFRFPSDNAPVGTSLGRLIGTTEYRIVRHQVPYLPESMIESAVGHVNETTFRGRPAGTLLFLGAKASRELTSDGAKSWRIDYRFARRSVPWNMVMRPDSGAFEEPQDTSGNPVYPSFEMSGLL